MFPYPALLLFLTSFHVLLFVQLIPKRLVSARVALNLILGNIRVQTHVATKPDI